MNNLERVERVWNDLDTGFSTSGYDSKLNYIKHITGFENTSKGPKTKIDYIIKNIKRDANKYNTEELERMNLLLHTLEGTKVILESDQLEAIEDFESLVNASLQLTDDIAENLLPDDFLDKLRMSNVTKTIENSITLPVEEIFNEFGCFGNCVILDNGRPVSVIATETNDFYGLYNIELTNHLVEKSKTSEFHYKVGVACNSLAKMEKLEEDILFFSDKYYNVDGNTININIGKLNYTSKIYSYHKVKLGTYGTGYYIPVESSYGKIKMMFI
ncbi:hypothetical protein [Paraclostridium bifermentans]|uniref:hypothetical protein n=1 Tax=Paraclostridium bifermentans TaxID=1490 RepID=UPI00374EF73B